MIADETFLTAAGRAFPSGNAGADISVLFRELPGWDSLASVLLVAEIHNCFGVHVSGRELADCNTLADLKSIVEAKH